MHDSQLLRRFVEHADQQAFARIVERHVNWVNSISRRIVHNETLAADVTQAVFILLAQKAASLTRQLSPWLFKVTRYAALKALRMESRRRQHEGTFATMRARSAGNSGSDQWDDLAEVVDEHVHRLPKADRRALLLRFYEDKSFPEIGKTLRISEEAARKRVNRALDRLRVLLQKKGITMATTTLGATIATNLNQPASAATVAAATAASQAGGVTASVASLVHAASGMLKWAAFKPAALVALVALLAGAGGAAFMQLQAQTPPKLLTVTSINGRVIDPDSKPVSGAMVHLLRVDSGKQTVTTIQTDAQGRFSAPRSQISDSMLVQVPGFGLVGDSLSFHPPEPTEEIQIKLRRPTEVHGKLVRPDGQPAAGVRVSVAALQDTLMHWATVVPDEIQSRIAATTDAQGAFKLPGMPQDAGCAEPA